MTAVLAYEMMSRGKDATGICTVDRKGRVKVRKKNEPANVFLAGRKGIGANAVTAIIHTRAATQGRPEDNVNNHPIVSGPIIGIHNGVIWNDDHLFSHYPGWHRHGRVDSEAIFAAINHLGPHRAAESLDGSWAIAWIDTLDDPRRLHIARGDSSPLHYLRTTNGSLVFASTPEAIIEACTYGGITGAAKEHITKADEGFYASIADGELTEHDKLQAAIDAPGKRVSYTRRGGWSGHGMYDSLWESDMEDWQRASNSYSSKTTKTTTPNLSSLPEPTSQDGILVPYQRYQVTGDPKSPKVGDRRKYVTPTGEVHTEICIDAPLAGATRWSLLVGQADEGKDEPTPDVVASDEPGWLAQVGDMITIPKELICATPGQAGDLCAEVLKVNDDGTMTIAFRTAIVDRSDTIYEVVYRSGNKSTTKREAEGADDTALDNVALFTL